MNRRAASILVMAVTACGPGAGPSGNPAVLYITPTDMETQVVLSGSPPPHEY